MSDQKVCPTCGTEYPLSERFCPRDGTALRATNAQGDLLGSIIAERYHVLKKLGEGGMGTVYLAEHVKMGRKAALKVMNPGMNQDPDAIARFNREAANASRLSHPNICAIYDFGETPDGLIYLAMEFIEGASLTSLIEKNGALQPARAAAIIHQAADALQVAHDVGIVHRDLKPDNIMIAKARDGSDSAKVVDFGIAKASSSDAQKVTKTGLVVGTPEYMSPEQLAGDKLDGRSDIYSLGLVAFNCLTGKLPFPSNSAQEAMIMRLTDRPKTLAEMKPDVAWPAALQAVMDKALARDAADRYQGAAEFGREMSRAVQDMPHTMAAEAGTQVMGASSAASSAAATATAKTVVAAPVPKTRVASAGDQRGTVPQAAAPKRGLPMPAIAAAAVVIIGGGGWYVATQMGANTAAPPGRTSPTGPQAPSGGDSGATAMPAGAQQDGGTRGSGGGAPANPGKATGRRGAAGPSEVPTGGTGGSNPGGNSGGSPGATNAVNVDDKISAWMQWTDVEKSDETNANRAIRDINATLPSLTGTPKVRAYLFLGTAYMIVGRQEDACAAWLKGRAESGGAEASIENNIKGVGCK